MRLYDAAQRASAVNTGGKTKHFTKRGAQIESEQSFIHWVDDKTTVTPHGGVLFDFFFFFFPLINNGIVSLNRQLTGRSSSLSSEQSSCITLQPTVECKLLLDDHSKLRARLLYE